jgi:hypothetical protein
MASIAFGLARLPAQAEMPALATTTPCRSISSGRHPSRSAASRRKMASAIGLRQVLPVHTKSTIRLASRRSVSSDTIPGRTTRNEPPASSMVETGWAYRARPSSMAMESAAPARSSTSAAVTAGASAPGSATATGPASIRMQSASSGWPGIRSRSRPAPTNDSRTAAGSRCTRLSGWSSGTSIATGPGQHRREIRRPTAVIRGAQSRASAGLLSTSVSRGSASRGNARECRAAAARRSRALAATT